MTKHFLLLALIFTITAPAYAQEVTAEKAAIIQAKIQKQLDEVKTQYNSDEPAARTLTYNGNVKVEPSGDYYAITSPPISVTFKDKNRRIEIGMISTNAKPTDKAGEYKTTTALPDPVMISYDETNKEVMRITIGSQKTMGTWNEDKYTFEQAIGQYSDIKASFDQGAGMFNIANLAFKEDNTENANGSSDGVFKAIAKDINFLSKQTAKQNESKITLESMMIESSVKDLDLSNSHLDTFSDLDNASVTLSYKGLKSTQTASAEKPNGGTTTMDSGQIHFSFDTAENKNVNAALGLNFNNIQSDGIDKKSNNLAPENISIQLKQNNLPIAAFEEIFAGQSPENLKSMAPMLLLKVPAILSQAGSFLEIEKIAINNSDYDVALNAIARADIMAAFSATAKGSLKVKGMDTLIAAEQSQGGGMMTKIKPLGRTEGNTDIFDFEVTKEGKVLVNGQDAMPVIMGARLPTQAPVKTTP